MGDFIGVYYEWSSLSSVLPNISEYEIFPVSEILREIELSLSHDL